MIFRSALVELLEKQLVAGNALDRHDQETLWMRRDTKTHGQFHSARLRVLAAGLVERGKLGVLLQLTNGGRRFYLELTVV